MADIDRRLDSKVELFTRQKKTEIRPRVGGTVKAIRGRHDAARKSSPDDNDDFVL